MRGCDEAEIGGYELAAGLEDAGGFGDGRPEVRDIYPDDVADDGIDGGRGDWQRSGWGSDDGTTASGALAGCLHHRPEEVERNGLCPASGEHAAEAPFAGADIKNKLAVQVAALFQHDGVEQQGPAWIALIDEADPLGGECLPSAIVVLFGHRALFRRVRAAIMQEGRKLVTVDATRGVGTCPGPRSRWLFGPT